jgi:oligopeptidase B
LIDLDPDGEFAVFYPRKANVQYFVDHHNDNFYILTNDDDSYNFKLVEVPVSNISKNNWKTIISHSPDVYLTSHQTFR